jgi:uncharacterized protein
MYGSASKRAAGAVSMRRNERQEVSGDSRAHKAPRAFDAFDLVRQRGRVNGEVAAADLPRLADCLAPPGGRLAYAISGVADEANRPALEVSIDGELWLTCQRCLQPMPWHAAQTITVLLARDERELTLIDDNDEHEVLLADAPLDALALVEDELLLTMPYAPRHAEDEGVVCVPADAGDAIKPVSPFGALAGLKAQPVKPKD